MSLARRYQALPEMKVGDTLTINGVKGKRGKRLNGTFVVGAVAHRYLSGRTAAAMKPWEAEGISRATWYRRRAETSAAMEEARLGKLQGPFNTVDELMNDLNSEDK